MNHCQIKYRGKKRTGEYRYWCVTHSAEILSHDFMCPIFCDSLNLKSKSNTIELNLGDWEGGVGIWGAMSPIYSTHGHAAHKPGIHIHTRLSEASSKTIDGTYDQIKLFNGTNIFEEEEYIYVDYKAALAYTASNVIGITLKALVCPHCNTFHSDEGEFAVIKHKKHLCTNCGKIFEDSVRSVANPIIEVRSRFKGRLKEFRPVYSDKKLEISQSECVGGIQIWGSNPAFLWSVDKSEEIGIHVHVYCDQNKDERIFDDTYGKVIIDGIELDDEQVRYFMVQKYLPELRNLVLNLNCTNCGEEHFDKLNSAVVPHLVHLCEFCGEEFQTHKKCVGNPIIKVLEVLQLNYEAKQK